MHGFHFDHTYTSLPAHFFQRVLPTPVTKPAFALFNSDLAVDLGLDATALSRPDAAAYFSGNQLLTGSDPIAQAYAGHQFANFTMLGDGRAILLGEHLTPSSRRFDIQLKGSGPTPYSRRGDGRAALGPMIREYVISEAMHAFGIPTTRSLAVVATGEAVHREQSLPGAILTRIAQSHIRVGTFQFAAGTRIEDGLTKLADYTIQRHFPECTQPDRRYRDFLSAVIDRQAKLVSQWMMVGFIHGVMNTDNMSICGETIDYGPCAFMDQYHPDTVFSSIDRHGRYAYGNQPLIAQWNLARFSESLLSLLSPDRAAAVELAKEALDRFPSLFLGYWLQGMRDKLGLVQSMDQDLDLSNELLNLMLKHQSDYTMTFRALANDQLSGTALFEDPEFKTWQQKWNQRVINEQSTAEDARIRMRQYNPVIIPRNHLVEAAIQSATQENDWTKTHQLLAALKNPYQETDQNMDFRAPPTTPDPDYQTFCGT